MDPLERARRARDRAEVLRDLAFEAALQSLVLQVRCEAVRLTPAAEAVLHLRLGRPPVVADEHSPM